MEMVDIQVIIDKANETMALTQDISAESERLLSLVKDVFTGDKS